ncbi:uncharacterized protein VP01_2108g3 [Puccinia sorghi]|uniref:Uncharacterized protein n=1 Tax=Puccinia sorghi TaxID=27349 RepID=A0A0L6VA27_9BASI|nr:uncharacterized protein VP01_2108g3 [Puccinia sorghi]
MGCSCHLGYYVSFLCVLVLWNYHNNKKIFLIWSRIKDLYAKHMNLRDFLDQVEVCLTAFDSIAYFQESSAIAKIIVSKRSDNRPNLTNPLNANKTLMNKHIILINKHRDIAFDEKFKDKKAAAKGAVALASHICPRNPHPCKDGKHNPKLKSHPEDR